jgi:ferric-dicitrate binding protein FerR (iron transport regulator)
VLAGGAENEADEPTWYVFLDAHLAECESCRKVARELSRQDRLLHEMLSEPQITMLAEKVERKLIPSPRRSVRWRWAVGGLAAAVLAFGVILFLVPKKANERAATVAETEGDVTFTGEAGPAGSSRQLGPGQGIRTGAGSRAVLRFPDASRLSVDANSSVHLAEEAEATGKRIHIEEGSLVAEVAPQPADRPMVLTTPSAEIVVVGTRFRLTVAVESTVVEVEDGVVRFRDMNTERWSDVQAGERASAGDTRHGVVSGQVRFKGVPLGSGVITFLREDGRVGSSVIANGSYKIYKAPVGKVMVTVQGLRGNADLPERYKDPAASRLTFVVAPKEQTYDLDLAP